MTLVIDHRVSRLERKNRRGLRAHGSVLTPFKSDRSGPPCRAKRSRSEVEQAERSAAAGGRGTGEPGRLGIESGADRAASLFLRFNSRNASLVRGNLVRGDRGGRLSLGFLKCNSSMGARFRLRGLASWWSAMWVVLKRRDGETERGRAAVLPDDSCL